MFIVFEGIDGSGKTTLSNRVAKALRGDGLKVEHVREAGTFASTVTQGIREFGRDARNLRMTAETELFLYAAREAQLLAEATGPALGTADVVIADRFFYTAEVLACHGRGVPRARARAVLEAASGGVQPDLVVLVDVDPHIARARRRVSKILAPASKPGSRKGLSGAGLQHRLRRGYLELAAEDPSRWLVVENSDADLDELTERLIRIARTAARTGAAAALSLAADSAPTVVGAPPIADLDEALWRFLSWIDRRAEREPDLAAYFLAGIAGPGIDERRLRLTGSAPEMTAMGLRGLDDELSWRLRRALAPVAPRQVARSLTGAAGDTDEAWRLRYELDERVPADVIASIDGRDDARAWGLRHALFAEAPDAVIGSLRRIDTERAWQLRGQWIEAKGGLQAISADPALASVAAKSVIGLEDARAWMVRDAAFAAAPVDAISSLGAANGDRAWEWRARFCAHAARAVMGTIHGSDDPRAWALRESVAERCKEAIDSIAGLESLRAWDLRERCLDVWPSSVLKSVVGLAHDPRATTLLKAQLERYPTNPSLLKHASEIAIAARAPVASAFPGVEVAAAGGP